MSRVEQLEVQVKDLSSEELRAFRNWFAQFDAALWDQQMEADEKRVRSNRSRTVHWQITKQAAQRFCGPPCHT